MRIGTIIFVFAAMVCIWLSMAGTLHSRHSFINSKLKADVAGLWGNIHQQQTGSLSNGERLDSIDIVTDLELEYRKKGHYWYSTYTAHFQAEYALSGGLKEATTLSFPLPHGSGMFNDFEVFVGEVSIQNYRQEGTSIIIDLPPNTQKIIIKYSGRGSDEWWYNFESPNGPPRNVHVVVNTNFGDFDFVDGGVSPDLREATDNGWRMEWEFENLLSGAHIGLELPKKSNAGPALIDICRYAPLGLMLFFGALAVCAVTEQRTPHPVHFVLLGAGFFSFHMLLVYLADATGVIPAFLASAVVSVAVNYSYTRQILGPKFAGKRLLPAQLLYLVAFSAAFLVDGHKGLPLVVLLILTLHMLMRVTARVDWEKFERKNALRSEDK